jgi:hypothetical protein
MDAKTKKLKALLDEIEVVAEHAKEAGFPELGTALRAAGSATLMGMESELIQALAPLVEKAVKRSDAWLELDRADRRKDGGKPFSPVEEDSLVVPDHLFPSPGKS